MKKTLILVLIVLLSFTGCRGGNENETNNTNVEQTDDAESNEEEVTLHDVTGYYSGSLDADGSKVPMTLEIVYGETLTGHVDIEVQNTFDLVIEEVVVDGRHVTFIIDLITSKGYFDGVFEGEVFKGSFTQNGVTFPFEFKLTDLPEKKANREELSFEIDDVVIKGEYVVPEVDGKMPVALIIAGSGPTDMNGNSPAGVYSNAYLYLAEALEEHGIATLRYNKRFLDNEIVSESDISFDDVVDDAEALVKLLKEDDRFSEVYIIGHSQGALIGKIVATRTEVDKVISLAGAGRTIDYILIDQVTPQFTEELLDETKFILEKLKNGETVAEVSADLQSLFRESIQPFMISWIKYDPQEIIKDIDSEVLIVVGGYDFQVPIKEGELLLDAKQDADYAVIETMNHILKETTADLNDNYASYQNIELPIHSELVDIIIDFLNK